MTEEDPAASVQHGGRAVARGSLGNMLRGTGGAPYVSLVDVPTDHDGAPLLLLSDLADHAKNLAAELMRLVRLARSRLPTANKSPEALV